jgi:hypothetical protein
MKEIKIGGQSRPVKYNINALIEFEELTGVEIIGGIDAKAFSRLKNMRALAFVGLKHGFLETSKEALPFTIDEVGKWIGFGDGSMNDFFSAFNDQSSSDSETKEETEEGKK